MTGTSGWDTLAEIMAEGAQEARLDRERTLLDPTDCLECGGELEVNPQGVKHCRFGGWTPNRTPRYSR